MKRIAIITGASRGIGRATAILAARHGYDVCINYCDDAAVAEEVRSGCENISGP